ncbi:Lipoamide acyltransferase component of branched-chain alpha-keto acid dehydrogenase complex [Sphingomonas aurantiaca]|uniref:Dihydrolipoamide acetyltransferase component of pyruvate dehydrogenase complex n=1 Tax=Sphingomonas aurantiaca TaxID=185949 RepID=A0A5E8A535_9SPHN|nr:dihydrolipoamide acetyltransferase family protein [Sphingomonas aurantiaca]VVT26520.1 Lipoamide acyltransferase component of branched-chain alpha-keto acid dehydrogenase complex [Sphingomonas aurantiaca]
MARFTFKLPDIGEGISEAEIVAWHVAIGDRVEEDSPIADMMTDKATVEMESPVSGVVVELAGEVGDQVSIGAALVVIETDAVEVADEVVAAPLTAAQAETAEQYEAENPGVEEVATETPSPLRGEGRGEGQPQAEPSATAPTPHPSPLPAGEREQTQTAVSPTEQKAHALASPAVRARARDLGIDLASVKTDSDRVRHADLDAYLRYGAGEGYHPPHASRAREDQPIKVIGMRRRIAENMAASKRAIPHFTYVDEIDVTALEAMRADLNANRGGRPKLTMLPLMIVAICKTIPDFPMLNARYDDEAGVVTRHGAIHLGMAAQTDAGLTVPVIRDAQDRNVWQLATEITRLAEAARAGKLAPSEMGGGTITVTSLGPLGGIATTPVINRPEVAIIGPNKIVERPVFKGDEVVRAKLMNLSISCDHRVVDGWDAASFVQGLKKYLETPVLLFAD